MTFVEHWYATVLYSPQASSNLPLKPPCAYAYYQYHFIYKDAEVWRD